VYQDVRWGPVNQGKVVMFHSRGNATVPLSSLPKEYQELLGYQPPPAATSVTTSATATTPAVPAPEPPRITTPAPSRSTTREPDWESYSRDRKTMMVLNNKLVERGNLTMLVGFVGNAVRIYNDSGKVRGFVLEIAERKNDIAQPTNELALRPNLWRRSGRTVLLRNYKAEGEAGVLVRVFVVPAEEVFGNTSYDVAAEPTFEQWKQLR
jgi:hypothetical protein